jgi:hypothetical protein
VTGISSTPSDDGLILNNVALYCQVQSMDTVRPVWADITDRVVLKAREALILLSVSP